MNLAAIEADVGVAWARAKHAVAWLLGMAAVVDQDVQTLEAESPLVKDAILAGEAAATAHGVPVAEIVLGAEEVLAVAKRIDAAQAPAVATTTTTTTTTAPAKAA